MNNVRWSDAELRKYVLRVTSWSFDESDLDDLHARFYRESRERLVPNVQAKLLAKIGTVTDPDGVAMLARDVLEQSCCSESERRWLLACPDPWAYLAEWVTRDIAKAYRATAGKSAPGAKTLKRLEKAAKQS